MITLKNPHSVIAALEVRPQDFKQITVPPSFREDVKLGVGESPNPWNQAVALARQNKIPILQSASGTTGPRPDRKLQAKSDEGGRFNEFSASLEERESTPLEVLFKDAKTRKGGHGVWLALDCLQDPHNIGAIFRTAAFFGIEGIILTEERSAPLSGTAYDVASGGLEHVPFTMQINLQRAFEVAKDSGLWILGTSEHTKEILRKVERDRPWLVVLGNEEKGMRRLTQEACDVLAKIPAQGEVGSLNVSVAAGIVISHLKM